MKWALRRSGLPILLLGALLWGDGSVRAADLNPGMARLYVIQGDWVKGPIPVGVGTDGQPDFYVSGDVWDGSSTIVASGPMAVGALAGALIGAALRSPEEPLTEMVRVRPLIPPSLFYLDHKKVAEPKEGEYAVADIAPGHYELKLCLGTRDCVIYPLEAIEGQVVYMIGNGDKPNGPILEICHQDCGDRIAQARQIEAFPKPGSNIPNF